MHVSNYNKGARTYSINQFKLLTMKKILFYSFVISLILTACNKGNNVTIFEIGDSREKVINIFVNDFTIEGQHWTKDMILDREYLDRKDGRKWITLYECVYKGHEYYKVRVYFSRDKVSRIELKMEKEKMKDLHKRLKASHGNPQRANLPHGLPGLPTRWEISTVYMGDVDGIIVTEDNEEILQTLKDGSTKSHMSDIYEVIVVSGEQRYELKSLL